VAWYVASRDGPLPNSVAVLPFENLSPDPNDAFFAAGLHGEILSQLAKISTLNVIGHPSMLQVARDSRTPQQVAAELDVETVLHATVEYANGRVRIRPQLIAGETGRTLWAESYDRSFEDIFAIQSEIAAEVANALRAGFSGAERSAIATPPTTSPAAYTAFLRASNVGNPADELALEYLDEATRLDPEFALAHAAKAQGLAFKLNATIGAEAATPSEWLALERRILEAANEALRLDPNVWLAHTALGNLHERRWRWTEAMAEYERAARFAPRGVRRVSELEPFVRDLDFAPSIRDQRDVVALNPGVAGELWVLGLFHAYAREAEAAAAAFREAVSLAPSNPIYHTWLAHAEAMSGRRDEALRELRRAEQLPVVYDSSISMVNLAYAYAQSGSAADARRLVGLFATRATDHRHHAGHWALAHLAVGDVDAARAALETVIEKIAIEEPDAGYLSLRLIRANIYADPVLDEPDFAALRQQLRGR
jgi:TolB-like protein/Tfp pilus assembly protein PilF